MGIKIKDIPDYDRPIERLIKNGPSSLSLEELLAIIIKTGTKESSSKDIARLLISKIGNIKKLNDVNLQYLTSIKGIGTIKAASILAVVELSKRINNEVDSIENVKLKSSDIVYKYYKDKIGNKKQECFYVVYLDNLKRVIKDKLLFLGTLNYSLVHPREVFKEAYLINSTAIICVHNHPSGSPLPSKEDYNITKSLIDVGNLLGIKVLDHLIICEEKYYSFLENGDINF